jgi:hypothetical protein
MLPRLCVFALLVSALTAAQPKPESVSLACRPADAFTTNLREFLIQLDTSTDSVDMDQRVGFGLPIVPVSSIEIQTDSLVCEQAATAYYSQLTSPPSGRAVAVIRMGSVYVVGDPRVRAGEFTNYAVFDSTFTITVIHFVG